MVLLQYIWCDEIDLYENYEKCMTLLPLHNGPQITGVNPAKNKQSALSSNQNICIFGKNGNTNNYNHVHETSNNQGYFQQI